MVLLLLVLSLLVVLLLLLRQGAQLMVAEMGFLCGQSLSLSLFSLHSLGSLGILFDLILHFGGLLARLLVMLLVSLLVVSLAPLLCSSSSGLV